MVKHTHTIRWQFADDCLRVFDHFVGLALKGLNEKVRICSELAMTELRKQNESLFGYSPFYFEKVSLVFFFVILSKNLWKTLEKEYYKIHYQGKFGVTRNFPNDAFLRGVFP